MKKSYKNLHQAANFIVCGFFLFYILLQNLHIKGIIT